MLEKLCSSYEGNIQVLWESWHFTIQLEGISQWKSKLIPFGICLLKFSFEKLSKGKWWSCWTLFLALDVINLTVSFYWIETFCLLVHCVEINVKVSLLQHESFSTLSCVALFKLFSFFLISIWYKRLSWGRDKAD